MMWIANSLLIFVLVLTAIDGLIIFINKEGIIDEIETKGSNESFNNEAKRAVSQIKEKWIPATVNGEKVRYRMRVPLTLDYTEYISPKELDRKYK